MTVLIKISIPPKKTGKKINSFILYYNFFKWKLYICIFLFHSVYIIKEPNNHNLDIMLMTFSCILESRGNINKKIYPVGQSFAFI